MTLSTPTDDDRQTTNNELSSSSSAFSEHSELSSLTSGPSACFSSDKLNNQQQQQTQQLQPSPSKHLIYSQSSPQETPPIPPRAPGRLASSTSIRALEREKRLSAGFLLDSTLHNQNNSYPLTLPKSFSLQHINTSASNSFNTPICSPLSFSSQSSSQTPLNSNKHSPIGIVRSPSVCTQASREIINTIAPLEIPSSINSKLKKSLDSPPIPPTRTQTKLSTFKLQQLSLLSLDDPDKYVLPANVIEKLPRWIVSALVIQQNSDSEPDLKVMQPCVEFSDRDFRLVCSLALPDNNFNCFSSSFVSSKPHLKPYSQFHSFRFQPSSGSHIPESNFPKTTVSPDSAISSNTPKEIFGFALYTCRPDPDSAKGYKQESIVILSHLNYPQLFNACLQLIYDVTQQDLPSTPVLPKDPVNTRANSNSDSALSSLPSFSNPTQLQPPLLLKPSSQSNRSQLLETLFLAKLSVFQTALKNISHWPDPKPNSTLELGFLGTIINISIPHYESVPLLGTVDLDTSSASFHSNGRNCHKIDFISTPLSSSASKAPCGNYFSYSSSDETVGKGKSSQSNPFIPEDAPVISASEPAGTWDSAINYISDFSELYLLYEYVLLGKPIVIYANTPHLCSSFISLLIDLIRPIPYGGRVREYVTAQYINSLDPVSGGVKDFEVGGITGITDPLLLDQVRNSCSSNVLIFALSPNEKLISAQKQATQLIKTAQSRHLASLTSSNSKHNKNECIIDPNAFNGLAAEISPITSPYFYFKTFHNGVGILRRQNNVWAGFANHVLYQAAEQSKPASSGTTKSAQGASSLIQATPKKTLAAASKYKDPLPSSGKGYSKNQSSSSKSVAASSNVLSKIFSKLGFSRKHNIASTPVTRKPKTNIPSRPNGSANSPASSDSYRTVPKASAHSHNTASRRHGVPAPTPVVTMLEPAIPSTIKDDTPTKTVSSTSNSDPKTLNDLNFVEVSQQITNDIRHSVKQHVKSQMLVPDQKFVNQITEMSVAALQLAIPKSINYISNLASVYGSPDFLETSSKSFSKEQDLLFDTLAMPKTLDFAIRFHFATLTSRFLSPLSCYLEPLSGSESHKDQTVSSLYDYKLSASTTGLGSVKRNVVDIVSSMTGFQRKDGNKDGKYERRRSLRKSLDGNYGSLKQHTAMITSQSMYNLALPSIKGSTHTVLESTPEDSLHQPNSFGNKSSNANYKPRNKNKLKVNSSSTKIDNIVGYSGSEGSTLNEKPASNSTSASNNLKISQKAYAYLSNTTNDSGNTSSTSAKPNYLPPSLLFAFEKTPALKCSLYGNLEAEIEKFDFFDDFEEFTSAPVDESSNATTRSPGTAQSPQPLVEDLRLSHALELSSPTTPSRLSMLSTSTVSSYNPANDALLSPTIPATPSTPDTPCSAFVPRKTTVETLSSARGHRATPSLTYSTSSNHSSLNFYNSNTESFDSTCNSKKGKTVSFGDEVSGSASIESHNNTSSSYSNNKATATTGSADKALSRTMSMNLSSLRSNSLHSDKERKKYSRKSLPGLGSPSLVDEQQEDCLSSRSYSITINRTPSFLHSINSNNSNNSPIGGPDFRKQDIYKEFMNNMNFANWLKMNHSDVYH